MALVLLGHGYAEHNTQTYKEPRWISRPAQGRN